MQYVNKKWIHNNKEIKFAEAILSADSTELLVLLSNWPDTNDLGIDIQMIDEELYKVTGPIANMLLFIYQYVLHFTDYTLSDILSDKKQLVSTIDKYLKKVW